VTHASESAPRRIQEIWDAVRARAPLPLPDTPSAFIATATQRAIAFLTPRVGAFLADVFATLGTLAAAQGAIGGLAFWLLGLGAPVFWGVAIAFCSLLPLGAGLVWVPAAWS
jgi:predicted PurR-regulated permease PerM